eukprot:XP_002940844.2 PREDICTED: C-C chemokine receptor type 9 [Xenopus tropicalis]
MDHMSGKVIVGGVLHEVVGQVSGIPTEAEGGVANPGAEIEGRVGITGSISHAGEEGWLAELFQVERGVTEKVTEFFTGEEEYEDQYTLSTLDYIIFDPGVFCEKNSVREFASYVLPPIYWCVFLFGLVGNSLVLAVYVYNRKLKTMTDTFLINLAIADILFLITLPFWAIAASHDWVFKTALCKAVNSMYSVNVYSGMLLLACISIDRYIAIVQATKAQKYQTKKLLISKLTCFIVWALSTGLSLPEILFSVVKEEFNSTTCTMSYPAELSKTFKVSVLSLKVTVAFCLPFLVMVFCYAMIIPILVQARGFQRHKALKVIFAVLSVFILSQLPYNSILVLRVLNAANINDFECATTQNIDIAYKITQSVAFLHCCLNPFIYVFVGVKFRSDLLKILQKCIGEQQWAKGLWGDNNKKPLSETRESKMGTLSL